MTRSLSLRARLTAIILIPLLCVACLVGLWQLGNARQTAADVFDRSLLSAALAVANDVAISDGDALSPRTRDLLADTSGGRVYYHVYGPDGVIVTGYATPPVGISAPANEVSGPAYFDATYLGQPVSGVRLQNRAAIEGFSGIYTTTVWQDQAVRRAFVRQLVLRSLVTITGLIASLAFIVWFGVRYGLRPLTDLEDAIARRSSDELGPIRRPVPMEVAGVVGRLNQLFAQLTRSMAAQSDFISNAAHQLRNPIAGVLSLAEAVRSAPSPEAARERADDLVSAAREAADLSQKLLLLERAKAISPMSTRQDLDLAAQLAIWVDAFNEVAPQSVAIALEETEGLGLMRCDPVMLREAVRNLIDNALRHAGPGLSRITVRAARHRDAVEISVADDGAGLSPDDIAGARERFRQVAPTSGSGLGVSIVEAIVQGHGGTFEMRPRDPGLLCVIRLPVS